MREKQQQQRGRGLGSLRACCEADTAYISPSQAEAIERQPPSSMHTQSNGKQDPLQHPSCRGTAEQPNVLRFRAALTLPHCFPDPTGRGHRSHFPKQGTQEEEGSTGRKESTKRFK